MPGKKKNLPKNNKKENQSSKKASIREKVSELLELPKEIVMDIPKLLMVGNNSLVVENFKGIIEYSDDKVRLNSNVGLIAIEGKKLLIREITTEEVIVNGDISRIEFLK